MLCCREKKLLAQTTLPPVTSPQVKMTEETSFYAAPSGIVVRTALVTDMDAYSYPHRDPVKRLITQEKEKKCKHYLEACLKQ
jgi:hypothetical protein